jgi:hypothetical protein
MLPLIVSEGKWRQSGITGINNPSFRVPEWPKNISKDLKIKLIIRDASVPGTDLSHSVTLKLHP